MDKEKQKKKILDLIEDDIYKPMKKKELAVLMQVPQEDRRDFESLIGEMSAEGVVMLTSQGKIIKPEKLGLITGTYIGNAKGFGFVTPDKTTNISEDIFIAPSNSGGALHRDVVMCEIKSAGGGHMRREGRIVKIIKSGFAVIVGTYERHKGYGLVTADEKKIGDPIYVRQSYSMGAVSGNKVAVKIDSKPEGDEYAKGKVVEILGHKNDPGVDILSIIRQLGIPAEFGKEVMDELTDIPDEVSEESITGRVDLRKETLLTIDGEDTKDIDDAVSLSVLPNGNYKLGVHIADVSHYVRENTELDREAYRRGTSVYPVDRVIPMLPQKLSNGICSLNMNTDRLALSCVMEINQKGAVVASEILSTVINVERRMTYAELNGILTDEAEDDRFYPMLKSMEALAEILREKRVKRGSVEFDFPEAKIIVDDLGRPIDIKPYSRSVATGIIEEFMIVCNETIAETFFWMDLPFIYRTHEEPDGDKIDKLSDFVRNFGFTLRKGAMKPGSLQGLLARVEDSPEESVINRVVLRSLKQARYTPHNIGHFGLASKCYCHFTSPIRRYPDLQIHRIIKEQISGGIDDGRIEYLSGLMPEVCRQCSTTERVAEQAERETDKLKKAQYMADKIGCEFEGIISGLCNWGVYVMLPNTVEGMISRESPGLEDFYYNRDLERYENRETGKLVSLGEKIRVRLKRVNIDERNIDFELPGGCL